ncbi:MAG TPA: hypothetical protein PLZ79_02795 [Burkholderiales bacterium]|nr:hypothetical protein [Burkholderiales bacterium]
MNTTNKLKIVALLLATAAPAAAIAESNFQTGSTALSATAKLDFQITIPKILFLQVGTGALYTNNTAVNLISFTVPAANVGDGTAIAATAGSGDLGNGAVTAIVRGNNGTVTLNATASGALGNGSGDSINYSDITTTPTALAGYATLLNAPTLANGVSGTITITPSGKVVNSGARWTYTYANSAIAAPGTYGGVNVNNSRVTYTAAMP